ncbi:hypothetical protein CDAR_74421 [Caerostris darwini]|uniref:Uncharacterized protein n=1 Tax=Caerostris darwini TaxID=1538125 RepID=A0AAV4UK52_9ARAC|nr:hypothetical protein CDAR_74421 [Caerostris darwini]
MPGMVVIGDSADHVQDEMRCRHRNRIGIGLQFPMPLGYVGMGCQWQLSKHFQLHSIRGGLERGGYYGVVERELVEIMVDIRHGGNWRFCRSCSTRNAMQTPQQDRNWLEVPMTLCYVEMGCRVIDF